MDDDRAPKPGDQFYDQRRHGELTNSNVRRSISHGDQNVVPVRKALHGASDLIANMPDDAVVDVDHAEAIAAAWNELHDLERQLPRIRAWCCGYHWGHGFGSSEGKAEDELPFSTFSAHATEAEAGKWIPYWEARYPHRGGRNDRWVVQLRPCDVTNFVQGAPPPKKYWTAVR